MVYRAFISFIEEKNEDKNKDTDKDKDKDKNKDKDNDDLLRNNTNITAFRSYKNQWCFLSWNITDHFVIL